MIDSKGRVWMTSKIRGNQEIADLTLALGCGIRDKCDPALLRYERIAPDPSLVGPGQVAGVAFRNGQ